MYVCKYHKFFGNLNTNYGESRLLSELRIIVLATFGELGNASNTKVLSGYVYGNRIYKPFHSHSHSKTNTKMMIFLNGEWYYVPYLEMERFQQNWISHRNYVQ